jgi:hypothetical protein
VTVEHLPARFEPAPNVEAGLIVQVTWSTASGTWMVFFSKHYSTVDGQIEGRSVFDGRYSPAEAPTAYQALMLGLSDYRTRH